MSTTRLSSDSLLTDDSSSTLRDSDAADDGEEYLKNPLIQSEVTVVRSKKSTCTYLNLGLCTVINLLVYLSARSLTKSNAPLYSFQDIGNLRRSNPFIGLERANASVLGTLPTSARNSTVFPPDLLSIVNASDPHQAYGDQYSKWISYHRGWMPPHDRNFMVSDNVSTIAEFRANDYRMERCQLRLRLPPFSLDASLSLDIAGMNKTKPSIAIHVLDTKSQLNSKTLSYSNRPPRKQKVASVHLEYGAQFTHDFHCPLNSLWAFEFSLDSDADGNDQGRSVQWTQGWTKKLPRVDLVQLTSA